MSTVLWPKVGKGLNWDDLKFVKHSLIEMKSVAGLENQSSIRMWSWSSSLKPCRFHSCSVGEIPD